MILSNDLEKPEKIGGKLSVKRFFGRHGLLSKTHPSYEYRHGQLEMAEAIESALKDKRHLIVEAGTGTGKTLAYLVPSILSGKRIVISTGTKNLQEQLFFKDLPFLQSLIERPLAVCYMKGRNNYLCRQKLYDAEREPVLAGLDELHQYQSIRQWEPVTIAGDRSEIRDLPEASNLWGKLDARSDRCAGQKCPQFERCFITEMHRRAAGSDIIIVNHHLFFADLAVRDKAFGSILPDYSAVIFDEAHAVEDIAGQYFGLAVSNLQINELVKDTAATSRQKFFATPELDRALIHLGDQSEQFFALFPADGRQAFRDHQGWLDRHEGSYRELLFALDALAARLQLVEGATEQVLPLGRRANLIGQALRFWAEGGDARYVYWTERRGRGVYLQATPIDVSEPLAANLFDKVESVILTSATLTVSGEFTYAKGRLGLAQARTLNVESQYNYAHQVLLYVPPHLPDPRQPQFTALAATEIVKLVEASRGRAFILFTSYGQMRQAFDRVKSQLSYPLLLQGEAPRTHLIESFRATPNAVLFATSSFWQGIDVQGEQLSLVIIDRLPFAVPTDPVTAARVDAIRETGGNAFYEYQIPQAALSLKQGFGRLIRSSSDRGVLTLLDNRITKLPYGRIFFDSLPPYRFTNNLRDVQKFFDV